MNPMNTEVLHAQLGTELSGRAKRLKAATHVAHDRLDESIMEYDPFASRARYGQFVTVQHQFHQDLDAIYLDSALDQVLPGLRERRRLGLIEQDLSDLGIVPGPAGGAPEFRAGDDVELPTALGWLYVAEGSNLGAAFLLKQAAKLGLSESFGARHLAAAPEGRGLHWKTFTAAFDAIKLNDAEEQRVITAAQAAFARVQDLVTSLLVGQAAG